MPRHVTILRYICNAYLVFIHPLSLISVVTKHSNKKSVSVVTVFMIIPIFNIRNLGQ